MKEEKYSRRNFLKIGVLSLGAFGLHPQSATSAQSIMGALTNPLIKAPRYFLVGSQNGVSCTQIAR